MQTKANEFLKDNKIPNYDGVNLQAPAAFYIGQSSTGEQNSIADLIEALRKTTDGQPVPQLFITNKIFPSYGVPLDERAKVYNLAPGDGNKGYLGAQWLLLVPPAPDSNGPVLNGGDYYILQATNPQTPQPGVTTPAALSVFTPSIPPGFTDPSHAVNPNPGDMGEDGVHGNLGTPLATAPQVVTPYKFGNGAPYASLVSTRANGTYSMNYRNEPVQLRVKSGTAQQTDLAKVFSSIDRGDAQLNKQPNENDFISQTNPRANEYKYPPWLMPANVPGGPQGTDPFTPLIRGYVGDDIQIRTLVGASSTTCLLDTRRALAFAAFVP